MYYHIRVYKDEAGEWRWQLRAKNGRIVADGAEGYKRHSSVRRAITQLLDRMPGMQAIEVQDHDWMPEA